MVGTFGKFQGAQIRADCVAHKLVGPSPVDFDVALAQMAPMPLQGPVPVLGPLEADKAFAVAPALGAQAQGDATAAKREGGNKYWII